MKHAVLLAPMAAGRHRRFRGDVMIYLTRLTSLIFAAFFVFSDGCKDLGEAESQASPSGTPGAIQTSYFYKAYSSDGSVAVSGRIDLGLSADSTLSGTWTLIATSDAKNIGPQVGSGRLAGNVHSARVFINLSPNIVDNNVFLNGTLGSNSMSGTWTWSTLIGPTASGKFEAIPMAVLT